jgi:hypothetical protein
MAALGRYFKKHVQGSRMCENVAAVAKKLFVPLDRAAAGHGFS